jgi:hypothetical protein
MFCNHRIAQSLSEAAGPPDRDQSDEQFGGQTDKEGHASYRTADWPGMVPILSIVPAAWGAAPPEAEPDILPAVLTGRSPHSATDDEREPRCGHRPAREIAARRTGRVLVSLAG